MKRTSRILIVMVCALLLFCISTAAAENKKPAKAPAAAVSKTTCTSAGKVNISLNADVVWDANASAAVKDADGSSLTASLIKKNKRLAVVAVEGMVKGQSYTVEISGVKAAGDPEYKTVTGSFKAKKIKSALKASKVSVNKNKVIVKFKGKAAFKDLSVTVTDSAGTELSARILKKTKSQIKVKVDGLKKGNTYKLVVTGVKLKKEKNYGSVTRTFKAK